MKIFTSGMRFDVIPLSFKGNLRLESALEQRLKVYAGPQERLAVKIRMVSADPFLTRNMLLLDARPTSA